jgi:type IV secretory pathway TrbD component
MPAARRFDGKRDERPMRPEGFELTIHQSAIKPQLVAGIPRQLALVLYTLMAALTFPLGTWYAIPPGLFLHLVFVAATKKDPFFWEVFRRAFLYRYFYRG